MDEKKSVGAEQYLKSMERSVIIYIEQYIICGRYDNDKLYKTVKKARGKGDQFLCDSAKRTYSTEYIDKIKNVFWITGRSESKTTSI